jgi:ankyrin repeat protein
MSSISGIYFDLLPNELVEHIVVCLFQGGQTNSEGNVTVISLGLWDISRFGRTCRRIHSVADGILYKLDATRGRSMALDWAIHHHRHDVLKRTLAAGVNPNLITSPPEGVFQDGDEIAIYRNYLSLHLASSEGDLEAMRLLLEHGTDGVNATTDSCCPCRARMGKSPEKPCATRRITAAQARWDDGEECSVYDSSTPLHVAVCNRQEAAAMMLLSLPECSSLPYYKYNSDKPEYDRDEFPRRSILHQAAINGMLQIVKHMIEDRGEDVDLPNWSGYTACQYALKTERVPEPLEVIDYLLNAGADINFGNKGAEILALICEVRLYNRAILALDKGISINSPPQVPTVSPLINLCDWNGRDHPSKLSECLQRQGRPLPSNRWMSQEQRLSLISKLILMGANIEHRDGTGRTPIIASAFGDRSGDITKLLLESGANVTTRDIFARNALLCVATSIVESPARYQPAPIQGKLRQMQLLVDHGEDVNTCNPNRETALSIICRHMPHSQEKSEGPMAAVSFLLRLGADPASQEAGVRSALNIALSNGNTRLVDMLMGQA